MPLPPQAAEYDGSLREARSVPSDRSRHRQSSSLTARFPGQSLVILEVTRDKHSVDEGAGRPAPGGPDGIRRRLALADPPGLIARAVDQGEISAPSGPLGTPLRSKRGRQILLLSAIGEAIVDKSFLAPSRLRRQPFLGRLGSGPFRPRPSPRRKASPLPGRPSAAPLGPESVTCLATSFAPSAVASPACRISSSPSPKTRSLSVLPVPPSAPKPSRNSPPSSRRRVRYPPTPTHPPRPQIPRPRAPPGEGDPGTETPTAPIPSA